jgi:hypothetical protein
VHKEGQEFQYYSRNLKPVQHHKACNISSKLRHPVLRPEVNGLVPKVLIVGLIDACLLACRSSTSRSTCPRSCPKETR